MAGGILQLIAYGSQDVYLTNNPQITFFKTVYRRHTNFSIESFERTVQDNPNFGTKNEITLFRNGDLITKMYLKIVVSNVVVPDNARFAWTRRLGHALLNSLEILIGGVRIDRFTGTWLDIWYELARSGNHDNGYAKMIGDVNLMTNFNNVNKPEYVIYIPLKFWFNKYIGLALPMIGILYHTVSIKMEFNTRERVIIRDNNFNVDNINELQFLDVSLLIDYIYLDAIERRKFASISHEYLIEQVQDTGPEPLETNIRRTLLHFNHPCKELIWAMKNGNYTSSKLFLCYTNDDNWKTILKDCSATILQDSLLLLNPPEFGVDDQGNQIIIEPGEDPPSEGSWEEFEPISFGATSNGKINVINNGTMSLWINTSSLLVGTYNLFDKISATIEINSDNIVSIFNITSTLSVRDISIPIELMVDTRANSNDVIINIFSNYGILIDGSENPVEFALLKFNNMERIDKRNGKFFNYLQPELHHSNTPKDGINVYSFCINPEIHQPTGADNFSVIENIFFSVWIKDSTLQDFFPDLNIINENTELFMFALSYNVLKISNGLAGVAYNG